MASYIDQIIMFLVGAYATCVGFGWLPSPAREASVTDWRRRYGRLFKVAGPMLLIISVLLTIGQYARSAQAPG